MNFIKDFIQRYKNARTAVKQIRNNEWRFADNYDGAGEYRLTKGDLHIWIANGAWFCEVGNYRGCTLIYLDCFGLFWRHYVWHFGVVPFLKKQKRKENNCVPILQ